MQAVAEVAEVLVVAAAEVEVMAQERLLFLKA